MDNREREIRNSLIDSAAFVIANEDYSKATTKRIAQRAKLNEAYIYRCFESKEDLVRSAFSLLDSSLAALLMKSLPLMDMDTLSWEERCRTLFMQAWELLVSVDYHIKFYVRYYYSEQYRVYAKLNHYRCYAEVINVLKQYFSSEADAQNLLRFVLESTISVAFHAATGELKNEPAKVERLFALLYQALKPNFRAGLVQDEGM